MKTFKKLILTLFVSSMIFSCIDDDNDELTGGAATGGVVSVGNPLISYVVGSGNTYSAAANLFQGNVQTTEINIYNTFTDNMNAVNSNRVLLKTIPITNGTIGATADFSLSFTYEELIAGLTVSGSPLPADDSELNIGDFWTLEYVSTTTEGTKHNNSAITKVAVGTRYAGIYTVETSAYWNSGSLQGGDWNGEDRVIESVDAAIYRHVGLAYWDANEFFFTIDPSTNVVTVLDKDLDDADLLLNGSPVMTCSGGTGAFENLTCDGTTSRAIPNDVTGEDALEFTVGYFRGVGATREFFERLVKQVD